MRHATQRRPSAPGALIRRLIRDRHGSTAVEFALVATPLFLLMFGIMEFGRMAWTQAALDFAVQESARCAAVTPTTCGSSSAVATYAAAEVSAGTYVPSSAFSETTAACGAKVTASFAYPFIATGLFSLTPTLSASACYPIQP